MTKEVYGINMGDAKGVFYQSPKDYETVIQAPRTRLQDAVDTFTNSKNLEPTHKVVKRSRGKLLNGESFTSSAILEPIGGVKKVANKLVNLIRKIR